MSQAKVVRATEKKESNVRIPEVKVASRGKISRSMEWLAKTYEGLHTGENGPLREVRWVYSPIHRPELSNVVGRRMEGWREVKMGELPEAKALLGVDDDDAPVRSGDVVLMWTSPENRAALKKEVKQRTDEQQQAVEHQYYETTKGLRADGMRSEHEVRPRGRSIIEEKEFEFEYTQKEE